jgi:class 3 adenylate cyclase
MENQGVPGKIRMTQATFELVQDELTCELNGPIIVKGKGEMGTWFVTSIKA